jgi:hypothetical protein
MYNCITDTKEMMILEACDGTHYLLTRQGITQRFDTMKELLAWIEWA